MFIVSAGVPGGPIVSRVTIEVEVVGSILTLDSYHTYKSTGRKRESVSWRNSMQIDEHKKLKSGNVKTLCAIKKKQVPGGRGEDIYNHGLFRRPLWVKPLMSEIERKSDVSYKKKSLGQAIKARLTREKVPTQLTHGDSSFIGGLRRSLYQWVKTLSSYSISWVCTTPQLLLLLPATSTYMYQICIWLHCDWKYKCIHTYFQVQRKGPFLIFVPFLLARNTSKKIFRKGRCPC